jgi:hypothetical protein
MVFVSNRKSANSGAVLLLAMVFLLLLAILAGTGMQSSIMELQMAANDQFREQAFQQAQAIAAAAVQNSSNFHLPGRVGFTVCNRSASELSCDESQFVIVDSSLETAPQGVAIRYQVRRKGPLLAPGLPLRQLQGSVSSALAYDAAIFEARVVVDGSDINLGRAEVAQGVALLLASSTGSSAE